MRMIQRFRNRGFTLVELMIVVAIIGVLAALAIYGVRRYLASAKTSEAKNSLGAIARGAVGAFEAETTVGQIVPLAGTGNTFSHDVCGNAQTVPANLSRITGRKYQPDPTDGSDFETGDATTGWKCLKYNMSSPQYYQYHYQADRRDGGSDGTAPTDPAGLLDPPTPGFGAYALGDLDGDGTLSGFGQIGEVDGGTQSLRLATEIRVVDEFE